MALSKVRKEALAKEMANRQHLDCIELEREKIEKKSIFRHIDDEKQAQRRQLEAAEQEENRKKEADREESEYKKSEKLAEELDKMKRQEYTEQRMRQHIRQESNELRQLQAKLKAAYCNKQLLIQLAEKKAAEVEGKNREKRANELLEAERLREEECRMKQKENDIRDKLKYKQELQDQMMSKDGNKRSLYEEFLRDKKMIDDIVQKIHDEDERLLEKKMNNMKKTREEMLAFKEAQDLWKKRERDAMEEENKRIYEYLQAKDMEEEKKKKEKYYAELQKNKYDEEKARKIYAEQSRERARNRLLQELKREELLAKGEERHRREIEKQLRNRLEIRSALMKQLSDNQERLKKEKEEDDAYKAQLMAQAEEDHRLDLLSDHKKRIKRMQLRKDIEQMLDDRRQRRVEQMQELLKLEEENKEIVEGRRRLVKEERLKMLQEHAKNLIGYIPRGVLREEDLEYLASDVQESYKKK